MHDSRLYFFLVGLTQITDFDPLRVGGHPPLIQGNPWLTGGAFGIEASVIAVVLGLGVGSYFIVQALRQQRIMRGLWWRGGINVLSNVA